MEDKRYIPELLCPAGDKEALCAAIAGGADAVYFGTDMFNARIRAGNFTLDEAREAIKLCHAHGVKAFITLNIAIHERELDTVLEYVSSLYRSGADALIVSDLGVMSLIKQHFPNFEIHASTQCTAHNLDGVGFLFLNGCKRVVVARELDRENLNYICKGTDAEIEMFIHGAHCMSVSGQCLMSYAMGGRSGNRGECAQPCRLPYRIGNKQGYPLSLKDMSLSSHMKEISNMGVASLKIEGRMKSPSYVYGVASSYRKMLNEGRDATKGEKEGLSRLFSRQGFSDGYFMSNISSAMLGIRSEENKEQSRSLEDKPIVLPKVKVDIFAKFIEGERAELTLKVRDHSVTVYGDTVERAVNAPMSEEDLKRSLTKLGNTPYEAGRVEIVKSDSVMMRISSLNALRREATDKLFDSEREYVEASYHQTYQRYKKAFVRSAVFSKISQIPDDVSYFDRVYVYADRYEKGCHANGIMLPPVILDSEWDRIEAKMKEAHADGVKYALITNIGQIERAKKYGFEISADYRFNVFNRPCVDYLRSVGFDTVVLSPELTLRQSEDMAGNTVIVYGNVPVMTTHKCIIKDTAGCDKCKTYMTDRMGASFYAEGIFGHRNIIYNSVPVYMADKISTVSDFSHHFIFSNETKEQVADIIYAYKNGLSTDKKIKRIK